MFTYVCPDFKTASLFIFPWDIIHSWFALNCFSFFKIAFAKSIRLPTSPFKYSFIRNDIKFSALVCSILAMDDAKPLKTAIQWLLTILEHWDNSAKLKISTHFEFPIGTSDILNVFVSCISSCLWNVFL